MPTPIEYSMGPSGPSRQASPTPTLPVFNSTGFDLSWAIKKGGSSTRDVLWMLLFAARTVYLNDDAMSTRVANTLGAKSVRRITSPSVLVPDILAFTGKNGGVLYAIAGTTNVAQWCQYILQFDQVPIDAGVGRVFSTFNATASAVYTLLAADYARNGGGGPVLLVGHSLGGAVADVVGKRLWAFNGGITSGVTTYGCPRVGNEDYAGWPVGTVKTNVPSFFRVATDKDFVPRLIPTTFCRAPDGDLTGVLKVVPVSYRHTFGRTIRYFDDNSNAPLYGLGDTGDITESFQAVRYLGNGGSPAPHRIQRYAQLLGTWCGRMQQVLSVAVFGVYTTLHNDLLALGV